VEPIAIGTLFAGFQEIMKGKKATTCMITHAIENDADSTSMTDGESLTHRGIAAEHRINLIVIVRVIAMI
jgi:hypothetical protein